MASSDVSSGRRHFHRNILEKDAATNYSKNYIF